MQNVGTKSAFMPSFFYHQIKTPISFWYRWRLNFKYLIQLLKTLLVELTN